MPGLFNRSKNVKATSARSGFKHKTRLESLNHQIHCRQIKFRILPFTIHGFSERGAGNEAGRNGQRVVAGNYRNGLRRASLAYTLVEVVIGVAILSTGLASICLGFSQGFTVIQVARENLRATQILQEKMETIRLFTWNQLTNAPAMTTFTSRFCPLAPEGSQGTTYTGTRTITNASISESYADDLREVTIQLAWTSGSVQRQRTMKTFVAQYGLHNYIYDGSH